MYIGNHAYSVLICNLDGALYQKTGNDYQTFYGFATSNPKPLRIKLGYLIKGANDYTKNKLSADGFFLFYQNSTNVGFFYRFDYGGDDIIVV